MERLGRIEIVLQIALYSTLLYSALLCSALLYSTILSTLSLRFGIEVETVFGARGVIEDPRIGASEYSATNVLMWRGGREERWGRQRERARVGWG